MVKLVDRIVKWLENWRGMKMRFRSNFCGSISHSFRLCNAWSVLRAWWPTSCWCRATRGLALPRMRATAPRSLVFMPEPPSLTSPLPLSLSLRAVEPPWAAAAALLLLHSTPPLASPTSSSPQSRGSHAALPLPSLLRPNSPPSLPSPKLHVRVISCAMHACVCAVEIH
jgi:hypothetical protein